MRRVVSLYLPTWPTDRFRKSFSGAPSRKAPLVIAAETAQDGSLLRSTRRQAPSESGKGRRLLTRKPSCPACTSSRQARWPMLRV